uniref:Uncharacterized protein n=1 Tax=Rhizophora mucronata TaxID=61149 RepID=A0A2P2QZF7_RHIMU
MLLGIGHKEYNDAPSFVFRITT